MLCDQTIKCARVCTATALVSKLQMQLKHQPPDHIHSNG